MSLIEPAIVRMHFMLYQTNFYTTVSFPPSSRFPSSRVVKIYYGRQIRENTVSWWYGYGRGKLEREGREQTGITWNTWFQHVHIGEKYTRCAMLSQCAGRHRTAWSCRWGANYSVSFREHLFSAHVTHVTHVFFLLFTFLVPSYWRAFQNLS